MLLDTQAWLWMQVAPERFSASAAKLIEDTGNELLLSAASSWEIAIKYALGKLPLPEPPSEYVPSRLELSGTRALGVEHRHTLHVAVLPHHHRDPFDRLIVAQAQLEGLPILTSDPEVMRYDVETIAATE